MHIRIPTDLCQGIVTPTAGFFFFIYYMCTDLAFCRACDNNT